MADGKGPRNPRRRGELPRLAGRRALRAAGQTSCAHRAHHGILDICKRPDLAAQVTLQPVEILDVDAAIIFADLLLPVEPMGLKLRFAAGEGPVIDNPVRTSSDIDSLSISNTDELGYVGESIQLVVKALAGRVRAQARCTARAGFSRRQAGVASVVQPDRPRRGSGARGL